MESKTSLVADVVFFGLRLHISELQDRLVSACDADLEHPQASFQDATVYESYIKFPTDVKLLWDCVEWDEL